MSPYEEKWKNTVAPEITLNEVTPEGSPRDGHDHPARRVRPVSNYVKSKTNN